MRKPRPLQANDLHLLRWARQTPRWHERRDSNPQHTVLETAALPLSYARRLVGTARFERATTAFRTRDAARLHYVPLKSRCARLASTADLAQRRYRLADTARSYAVTPRRHNSLRRIGQLAIQKMVFLDPARAACEYRKHLGLCRHVTSVGAGGRRWPLRLMA